MEASRQHTLFISSKNRVSGTPSSYSVVIPPSLCDSANDETIRITLQDLVLRNNFTAVQPYNCSFVATNGLVTSTVSLPLGSYNVYQLAETLEQLLPGWKVSFDPVTNLYTFDTGPGGSLIFDDPSLQNSACSFLGFRQSDRPVGGVFTSTLPVDVGGEEAIYLHTDLPSVQAVNIDDFGSLGVTNSTCFAKIPVLNAFGGNIVYQDAGDTYSALLSVSSLNQVRFWLTNEDGRLMAIPNDWTLTLKVTYLKPAQSYLPLLREIADSAHLILMRSLYPHMRLSG